MSDYTATYTALANFSQLKREAKSAESDLKDLKKQQAELNAESMASGPKIGKFSEAMAKAAQVSRTHRDALKESETAQSRLSSATLAGEAAFRRAKEAQSSYAKVMRETPNDVNATTAAHDKLRSSLISAENAMHSIERATRDVDKAHTKATGSTHLLHNELQKIGNNQGAIAGIVNMTNKLAMMGAKFAAMGSLVQPAVGALASFGAGAVALAGTLGPLAGSLAALPQLFSAIGQGAATAVLGFGGVFKAVGALNQANVQAGIGAADMAHQQMLASRAVQDAARGMRDAAESVVQTQRDTAISIQSANIQVRDSHEAAEMAQRSITDTRRDATRALEDLETAVRREALAERSASLSVAEARANLQKVMLDPNSTAFQREEAGVTFQEAQNRQQDTLTQGNRNKQDLATEQSRGGVEGTTAMISARRGLRDANEAVNNSERDLSNTIHDAGIQNRNALEAQTRAGLAYKDALYNQAHAMDAAANSAKNMRKIFADMSPEQIALAKQIYALKGAYNKLQDAAAAGLLPGVSRALTALTPLFKIAGDVIGKTAKAFGDFIEKFAKQITTPAWLKFFSDLGDSNIKILSALGDGILAIADAFRIVMTAAMPFVEFLANGFATFAKTIRDWLSGHGKDLNNFFGPGGSLRQALHGWGDVLKNVGTILINVFKAAMPFGMQLLGMLDRLTAKWATALAPPKAPAKRGGKGHMRDDDDQVAAAQTPFEKFRAFLDGSMDTFKAAGHLIGVIADAFARLAVAGQGQDASILNQIADKLVPAIAGLLLALGNNAPLLIDFMTNLGVALTKLLGAEGGGVLKLSVTILNDLATALNSLLSMGGGMGAFVKVLLELTVALKALSLVGKITGISGALGAVMGAPGAMRARRQGYRAGASGEEGDPTGGGYYSERKSRAYRRGHAVGSAGRSVNQWVGGSALGRGMQRGTARMDEAGRDEYDQDWFGGSSRRSGGRGDDGFISIGGGESSRPSLYSRAKGRLSRRRGGAAAVDPEEASYGDMYSMWGTGAEEPKTRGRFRRGAATAGRLAMKHGPMLAIAAVGGQPDVAAGVVEGKEKFGEGFSEHKEARWRREAAEQGIDPEEYIESKTTRGRTIRHATAGVLGVAAAVGAAQFGERLEEKLSGPKDAVKKANEEYATTQKELADATEEAKVADLEHSRALKEYAKSRTEAAEAAKDYQKHIDDGTTQTKEGKASAKRLVSAQAKEMKAEEKVVETQNKSTEAHDKLASATEENSAAKAEVAVAKKEQGLGINPTLAAIGVQAASFALPSALGSIGAKVGHRLFGEIEDEEGNVTQSAFRRGAGKVGRGVKSLGSKVSGAIKSRIGQGGEDGFLSLGGDAKDALEGKATDAVESKAGKVGEKIAAKFKGTAGKLAGHASEMAGKIAGHMGTLVSKVGGAMGKIGSLMMANPWLALVAALIIIVVLVIKHWDTIKKVVSKALGWIGDFISKHWPIILELLLGPFGYIIVQIVKHWDDIKSAISKAINFIIDFVKHNWKEILVGLLLGPFAFIVAEVVKHWEGIKTAFSDAIGAITDVLGAFGTAFAKVWYGIQNAASKPIEFLINTVIQKGIIDNVNMVLSKLPGGLQIPSVHFGESPGGSAVKSNQSAASIKRARGGLIPGSGDTDSVNTYLMPGEYVVRKSAVKRLGVGFLERLNSAGLPHFDKGGGFLGTGVGPSLTGLATGAWDGVKAVGGLAKRAGEWATIKGLKAIKGTVNGLIDHIPGMGGMLGNLAHGTNNKIFEGLINYVGGGGDQSKGANAKTMPGEFVLSASAAKKVGPKALNNMNYGSFFNGGFVGAAGGGPIQYTAPQPMRPVNARSVKAAGTSKELTVPVNIYYPAPGAAEDGLQTTVKKLDYLGYFGD